MFVFLQLLLLFSVNNGVAGERKQEVGEELHLRRLWKLHVKETLLGGKDAHPHPIRGAVEQQLLYCRVGIGFHLQILPNGSVGGVHKPSDNCQLKVFAMKHGVVGIRGVKSGLYLCMGGDGLAYGAEQFSDDCLLKEKLEENHYNTYSSVAHPGAYLALSHKGELRRGIGVGPHRSCTHFLPRYKDVIRSGEPLTSRGE